MIGLLLAVALSSAPAPVTYPPDRSTDFHKLAIRARDMLDNRMTDFPSARVRECAAGFYHAGNGMPSYTYAPGFICMINAKNRMGGYTGWQATLVVVHPVYGEVDSTDPRSYGFEPPSWIAADDASDFAPEIAPKS